MIRPRRIGTTMLLTMCVPLTAMGAVAGYVYVDAGAAATSVEEDVALATTAAGPDGLVGLLQTERARTSIELLDLDPDDAFTASALADLRSRTDSARQRFDADLAEAPVDTFDSARPLLAALDRARSSADGAIDAADGADVAAGDDLDEAFSAAIGALLDGTTRSIADIGDADLRRHATSLDLAVRVTEADARLLHHLLIHTVLDDLATPGVLRETAALAATSDELLDRLALVVDPALTDAYWAAVADRSTFTGLVTQAIERGSVDLAPLVEASAATDDPLAEFRRATTAALVDTANARSDDSRGRLVVVALALLGLATSIAAAIVGARNVTRPLHRLVDEADALATTTLPDAVRAILETPEGQDVEMPAIERIEATTKDEVAVLADALNKVHVAALEQAVEQAVLRRNVADAFVNLGRRNQALVDRQLEFITDLQQGEHDPDALQNLFRLDHLATRMRRHAESLLLLAGDEPMRIWSDPIPVVDVVRSALGEIDDFRRVDVEPIEHVAVSGDAVADVSHMLAELIENALAFSPPHRTVSVRGESLGDRFRVRIDDDGVGMTDDDLAEANVRLQGLESFAVPPSRYLGHFVTGRLAQRHGVEVRLVAGSGGGVTAEVDLPGSLLWTAEPTAVETTSPATTPPALAVEHPSPSEADEADSGEEVSTPQIDTGHIEIGHIETVHALAEPTPAAPATDDVAVDDERPALPTRVRGAQLPTTTAAPIRRDSAPAPKPARVPEACPSTLSTEAGSVFELFNGIRRGEATTTSDPATDASTGAPA